MPRRRWLPAAPGQARAPAINPALDLATKPGPAPVAALEAAPVVAAEVEPAVAAEPALVRAINPEVVGTSSRVGGK